MSIEGQGHFFTIYFPGFVCFVLYSAKISGERLQDHWSSGFAILEDCLFSDEKRSVSFVVAYNRDCEYTLESPHISGISHLL